MKRYAGPVLMEEMTVEDVTHALKQTTTVILPVGCTEQHGYHLPLKTDCLNAWELARRAGERAGCLVAPLLPYSFSGGELAGTVNVPPHIVGLFVSEICKSLAGQGFKTVIVLLGHGGTENAAGIREALQMTLRMNKHLRELALIVTGFGKFSPTAQASFGKGNYHASLTETSLILHWRPDLVKMDRCRLDSPELCRLFKEDPDAYQTFATLTDCPDEIPHTDQIPAMQIGVMGDVDGACAELGARIEAEILDGLTALIRSVDKNVANACVLW
ncbi:MAG: creatininase family protein [Kiritimatiellae bacterium]|nr:creatininase family protein [Kiritimatiellia bacterium]